MTCERYVRKSSPFSRCVNLAALRDEVCSNCVWNDNAMSCDNRACFHIYRMLYEVLTRLEKFARRSHRSFFITLFSLFLTSLCHSRDFDFDLRFNFRLSSVNPYFCPWWRSWAGHWAARKRRIGEHKARIVVVHQEITSLTSLILDCWQPYFYFYINFESF